MPVCLPRLLLWPVFLLTMAAALPAVSFNGTDYISLRSVAERLGMERVWVERGKVLRLKSEWSELVFTEHKRDVRVNGTDVYLGYAVAARQGDLYIAANDFKQTLRPLLQYRAISGAPKLYHIVLDPGHGGKDTGARNAALGLDEKDLVLELSRRIERKLAALGYKVTLTRESDTYPSFARRTAIANERGADLFVSVHLNAVESRSVRGVETYVFTPLGQPSTARTSLHSSDRRTYPGNKDNTWSTLCGYLVQDSLREALPTPDRGLKRARLAVLKNLDCPGILLEPGFLSHPEEGRRLATDAYQEEVAEAVVRGIFAYQKALNRARGME